MCVAAAFSAIGQAIVDAMSEAVAPQRVMRHPADVAPPQTYEQARRHEPQTEATNEPYLLPAIDPEYIDDRGFPRPWAEIAAIVRAKVAALGA
jgi:hypothetical protein